MLSNPLRCSVIAAALSLGICCQAIAGEDASPANVQALIESKLAALDGHTGFAFTELTDQGPKPLFHVRADERFAVGSSFKLYILGALADEVNADQRRLDNTMLLVRQLEGPPHSEMSEWPLGSPVTLHTLALKMIWISDNTATDHLHHLLGRERIERQMQAMGHSNASVNRPLLSTREMTMLRDRNTGLPGRYYRSLSEGEKRRYLHDHCERVPNYGALDFDTGAYELAEWYASPMDMARALAWLERNTVEGRPAEDLRAVLAVDPKLQYDKATWAFVGFKGGSEDQVLAGNWLLANANGHWYTMHLFWNSPKARVEPERMIGALQKILAAIEPTLPAGK